MIVGNNIYFNLTSFKRFFKKILPFLFDYIYCYLDVRKCENNLPETRTENIIVDGDDVSLLHKKAPPEGDAFE